MQVRKVSPSITRGALNFTKRKAPQPVFAGYEAQRCLLS
jgi:hypothetical protein